MGSIRGGSAHKLIIFKRRGKSGWYFPPDYASEREAWEAVRAGFVEAIDLAGEGRWGEIEQIEALKRGPALVAKTLWAYYPSELLPITSGSDLRHFLEVTGSSAANDHALGNLSMNRALLESLREVPELAGLSTKGLERFLYSSVSPHEGRLFKIAPGEDAKYWPECLEGGYICVGWDDIGDLRRFDSKDEFLAEFQRCYLGTPYSTQNKVTEKANELWTLLDIDAGERIAANRGISQVLGVGRVEQPGYVWDASRLEFKHTVRVAWDTSFAQKISPQGRWGVKTVLLLTGKSARASAEGGYRPAGGARPSGRSERER